MITMLNSPPAMPKVIRPIVLPPTDGINRLSTTPAAIPDMTSGNTIAPKAVPRGSSGSAATTSSAAGDDGTVDVPVLDRLARLRFVGGVADIEGIGIVLGQFVGDHGGQRAAD